MAALLPLNGPQLSHTLILLLVLLLLNNHLFTEGTESKKGLEFDKRREGTVRTIKADNGDLIDCVDIYKQPAFDHPLLKNHIIDMTPSSFSRKLEEESLAKPNQSWKRNNEQCPEGTVPIIRKSLRHGSHTSSFPISRQRKRSTDNNLNISATGDAVDAFVHQYAEAYTSGVFYGAQAAINIWNPKTEEGESSIAQVWITSADNKEHIQAGWMVLSTLSDDLATRSFTYWTSDDYQNTGCYNLQCPGFVHISQKVALGSELTPVSTYNGEQVGKTFAIEKNTSTGNWWLQLDSEFIGYWPGELFPNLRVGNASTIVWGGSVAYSNSRSNHTTTQMGSGHFPDEGFGKSSYFKNIAVMDDSGRVRAPDNLASNATNLSCYDVHIDSKDSFYFGGPGYSDKCA